MKPIVVLLLILLTATGFSTFAKTVRHELVIKRDSLNLTGKKTVDWALTVNGTIPAPTLEFTEGDEVEILVKNGLQKEEVSIHWHGILLPPEQDGVPYINTPPIFPGKSYLFKFKLRQHGTYWYHSHTMLQEQKGVFGAFIIHPKNPKIKATKEVVAVLSDWTDENPDKVIRNLKKDGDYYLYKKDSVRSIGGAISNDGFKTYLGNEWDRMGGMDLSDVGYDAFFINAKNNSQLLEAHPGETVRLRIINAAASSYFYVSLGDLPLKVISADGIDIDPIEAKEILIGMAETYDVLVKIPEHKNYELRATSQDITGFASAWMGMGEKVKAPAKPALNLYAPMNHTSHEDHKNHEEESSHEGHHGHHEEHEGHEVAEEQLPQVETLTVDELKALTPTTLPKGKKLTEIKLVLGGDMERYVWHINGKTINQDSRILVNEGDIIRFTFDNETMMHHPMHLHGHFFRVLNKNGEYSPLKHTVDVSPHSSRTIELYANEPGEWMLHCHNLYHMKTGMARVMKYTSFKPRPEIEHLQHDDPHMHEHVYSYGKVEAYTQMAEAQFKVMRTWDELEVRGETRSDSKKGFHIGGQWDFEGDLLYRYWFGNFFNIVGGATLYDEEGYGMLGVGYLLPLLIESQIFINHDGKFRLDLEKRFQWTKNIFTDAEFTWREDADHEGEFKFTLMYGPSWSWAAGVNVTNDSIGLGAQAQF